MLPAAAVAAAAAVMVVMFAVVIAPDAGIVRQVSGKEGLHCLISTAGNTAVQLPPVSTTRDAVIFPSAIS